jgi:hypothetical protein
LRAPDGRIYEIINIASNTSLTITPNYLGSNQSGQAYEIVPTQSFLRDLAAQAADLVNQYSTIANTVGQGKFADGTVGTPGIRFNDDPDTGVYRIGANILGVSAGGGERIRVTTTGAAVTGTLSATGATTLAALTASSTVTGTKLVPTGNITAGNGMYLPAANTVAFSTDGVERVRVDSAGRVGVGATPSGASFEIGRSITGGTTWRGLYQFGPIQSDVTSAVRYYQTLAQTQAASFTLTNLIHYFASQAALGAGSSITNQYGFEAQNSLTGATNNFGFRSDIASGTGRFNFYAAGSAVNYFAGNVGIGTTSPDSSISTFGGFANLNAASFNRGAIGSGLQIFLSSGAYSVVATDKPLSLTSNTSDILLTTNNAERMRIDSAGRVGIGGTPFAGSKVLIGGNTDSASMDSLINTQSIQSVTTSKWNGFATFPTTQAASFTLPNLRHFSAAQGAFGAGSTITAQAGFDVASSLTGATNNYGFFSNIATATGRFNFYAAGSADNFFAGNVLVGQSSTATPGRGNTTTGVSFIPSGAGHFSRSNEIAGIFNRNTSDGAVISFFREGGNVGTISVTTTATAYNTSSDYRLKEDAQPMADNITRLMALNPVNFAWKVNGERVDGFLAHEAQAVVPESVTGTKDAVDDEGNPEYQAIDQSKLVPLLTAALQDAVKRIEALEAQLEGN